MIFRWKIGGIIMKRRIICFMLTLALLLSVIPAQAVFAKSDSNYQVVKNATTSAKKRIFAT